LDRAPKSHGSFITAITSPKVDFVSQARGAAPRFGKLHGTAEHQNRAYADVPPVHDRGGIQDPVRYYRTVG
jgi:hypothetical protein